MINSIGFPPLTIFIFCAIVVVLLLVDMFYHRKGEPVSFKSAVLWSLFYVAASMCFAGYLFVSHGKESANLFLTGYTLEKVLAFDNLFVFSMIFAYFKIPPKDQHAALHWGIAGAIVFRLLFVFFGVSSMHLFGPVMELVFAGLIAGSVYIMLISGDDESCDYNNAAYIRLLRKFFPTVTPLFVAIVAIEVSDIMFSFDSVPAIIAVTKDPLLIYSAMIFAILGLRSMYFVISSMSQLLVYMDIAVMFVLSFIAIKLGLHSLTGIHIDPNTSLIVVLSILSVGVIASLINQKVNKHA